MGHIFKEFTGKGLVGQTIPPTATVDLEAIINTHHPPTPSPF